MKHVRGHQPDSRARLALRADHPGAAEHAREDTAAIGPRRPPIEYEAAYYARQETPAMGVGVNYNRVSGEPGAVHTRGPEGLAKPGPS